MDNRFDQLVLNKIFGINSYNDTHKKYISLKYLKSTQVGYYGINQVLLKN